MRTTRVARGVGQLEDRDRFLDRGDAPYDSVGIPRLWAAVPETYGEGSASHSQEKVARDPGLCLPISNSTV